MSDYAALIRPAGDRSHSVKWPCVNADRRPGKAPGIIPAATSCMSRRALHRCLEAAGDQSPSQDLTTSWLLSTHSRAYSTASRSSTATAEDHALIICVPNSMPFRRLTTLGAAVSSRFEYAMWEPTRRKGGRDVGLLEPVGIVRRVDDLPFCGIVLGLIQHHELVHVEDVVRHVAGPHDHTSRLGVGIELSKDDVFLADREVVEIRESVVPSPDLVDLGGFPSRGSHPDLSLAVTVSIRQRHDFRDG